MKRILFEESPFSKFFFSDTRSSPFWLIVRLYVGYQWVLAGWEKIHDPMWTGSGAGTALSGFLHGALMKAGGAHPDVQGWYAAFLQNAVISHPAAWSVVISYGEFLVGLGLIVGLFTGIAAFFGLFMNMNYLLAGTVSVNPILFVLSIGLMLGWKVSGYLGLDRFVLPFFGTPWHAGALLSELRGNKGKLIIVRHNESEWNKENKWTGKVNVGLSDEGFKQSRAMGELIKGIPIDKAFISAQFRSMETLMCMEDGTCLDIPTERSAALNERDYGDYTGRNKSEVEQELGHDKAFLLRRGWNEPVPNGETLKMVYERVVPFYLGSILPLIREGKTVLVVSHGNALRALMKYIENISDEDIANLEMLFGVICIYQLDWNGHSVWKEMRSLEMKTGKM